VSVDHGFHATLTARPGKGDELVALLLGAPSLPNPDCVAFLVCRSASDPDTVFVTEGWTSREAHGEFFATGPAKDLVERLRPLLARDSEYVDAVPVGGKAAF
jgi:quinol monooxygenase YgiN